MYVGVVVQQQCIVKKKTEKKINFLFCIGSIFISSHQFNSLNAGLIYIEMSIGIDMTLEMDLRFSPFLVLQKFSKNINKNDTSG